MLRNAKEALGRRLADTASQQKLLVSLGQAFGLEKAPRRVEVYDNSHIMGTNAVGAMVVAGANGFMKQHYRTFNMKSEDLKPGDDYGMMREMLQRRFARLVKEEPRDRRRRVPMTAPAQDAIGATTASRPGPTWCSSTAARGSSRRRGRRWRRSASARSDVALVGIAKGRDRDAGRETFFKPGQPPFKLPPRDPALYFVQRLRDEAHRFAIGAHRAKRKRELVKNPLDEISGHRTDPQARAPAPFRHREGDPARRPRGSHEGAGRECRDGPRRLRFLP